MPTEELAAGHYLQEIWSLCTTLTPEAMSAAAAKAAELKFDPDRGTIPLQESFINLSSARATLEDAIEKQKLVQLPITVQKDLLANLQAISKAVQGLAAGTDEIVNIANSVEALNTSIWKYGLHNLSDQVLGYQKKLNQLKSLEVQLMKAFEQLTQARGESDQVHHALTEIEQRRKEAQSALDALKEAEAYSSGMSTQLRDAEVRVSAVSSTVQQYEKQSGELTSSIRIKNNELIALDESIRRFYAEVEDYRKKIAETGEQASDLMRRSESEIRELVEQGRKDLAKTIEMHAEEQKSAIQRLRTDAETHIRQADEQVGRLTESTTDSLKNLQQATEAATGALLEDTRNSAQLLTIETQKRLGEAEDNLNRRSEESIEKNHKDTQQLVADLDKLKDQIREQIQQATGFSLFGAFQARQNEIAKSKVFWIWAIAGLVAISAGVTVWIAYEASTYTTHDLAFWVKLSLTIPLAFAISFCTVQYGRERRLEEEYAFKSSISVSLNPYRDLIQSMLEKDGENDQKRYTDFVIDSVTNVFTPPTDKVFDSERKPGVTAEALKQTAELIGTVVKATK